MIPINAEHTFRAFRNRNYRLYFGGQSLSLIGTWMQRTAVSWVIYTMTHSPLMLGVTAFASQFPSFLFSIWGGVVSDRYDRYKLLLLTQTASMIQAALLAVLTFVGNYSVWQILALSVLLGVINAFDVPARQPLVHEMIKDKNDLPNALAFNSSMVNLARLIGPALSGLVLQHFGAAVCFLFNAISFVAVIGSLLLMKLPPYVKPAIKKKVASEFVEGFNYLRKTPAIGMMILLLTLVSLLVLPYNTLLPVYAKLIFNGDAATFGYINSFIGLGAVSGAFFLASLKSGANLKLILLVNTIILGVGLVLFSHLTNFPLAMVCAVLCGFGTMSQTTICNTVIQTESHPAMRGRVIGYFAMSVFGMLPLGGLLIGTVSEHLGAPDTILAEGIIALVIAALFSKFLRKKQLNESERKGLPEAEALVIKQV